MDHAHLEILLTQLFSHYFSLLLSVHLDYAEPNVYLLEELAYNLLLGLFVPYLALLLSDALQGKFFVLDQDHHRVGHEVLSDPERVFLKSSAEQPDLQPLLGQLAEDVLDFFFEAPIQHFVSLVHDEQPQPSCLQLALVQQVLHTPRGADYDLGTILQLLDVLAHRVTSDETGDLDLDML